jgi:periplasmic protein TonB
MKIVIFTLILILTSLVSCSQTVKTNTNKNEVKTDSIYTFVEKMPEFPGGMDELMNFIRKNLIYPEETLENGICGRIYFSFVVNFDGSLIQPEIVRGCDTAMNMAILKFINKMPKWIPGEHNGKKVKVKMSIPVNIDFE